MPLYQSDLKQKHSLVRNAGLAIRENEMLAFGDRVLVGVSGGPDSVALLHVLLELGRESRYQIGVAHVDHGLREKASKRDAAFVEDLAKKRNVPYYIKRIDLAAARKKTGGNLEEAGRDARYRFFHETADRYGFDRIAVGHHLEDNAELILMNIIRGSGPTGMSGIAPVRGRIVRPLLHCRRSDIQLYLNAKKIPYVHDESNDNTRFHRNHIRHCLIPALEQYNPSVVENLHRLGQITGLESRWIDEWIAPVFDAAILERSNGRLVLDVEKTGGLHAALKRRMIRNALLAVKGNLRRIGYAHIDAVIGLLEKPAPSGRLDLPDRVRVTRCNASLVFTAENQSLRSPALAGRASVFSEYEYWVTEKEAVSGRIDIPEAGVHMVLTRMAAEDMDVLPSGNTAALDWDRLVFPLSIRNMRPGERFMPLGMRRTQKLKNFFINNKIPAYKRGRIPLLQSGTQVAWIAGLRIDDRFKITRETKSVLLAEVVDDSPVKQQFDETVKTRCV
ncbi:MAG: tRNA lysidine(34) synthetase TilS [Desulfosalsimonadaceae bacterium]